MPENPEVRTCFSSRRRTGIEPAERGSLAPPVLKACPTLTLPSGRVAPELADSSGSLEVGEHQGVEQLGAASATEGVEVLPEAALKLIGPHG